MRTLKYALLGLISRRPITGYDLAREFDKELVNFWHAEHSQIYPELKKLTQEGLITYAVEIQGERLEKKVYSITEAGQRELLAWLKQDEPLQPTAKDIFRLRMYFAEKLPPEELLALIASQRRQHERKLEKLEKSLSVYGGVCPARAEPAFGDYLVLHHAVSREKDFLRWLDFCAAEVEKQR